MTFKLTIGDKLRRDERFASTKNAADLVRDFRTRFRSEAQAAQGATRAKSRQPAQLFTFGRKGSPRA